ncbi:DUF1616 domain-containing protein [Candidatus Bathyarchaeota archaeon]|nr:DUF1616 domain-containing protein [Candidatus Bathyarchaeota archaeon]
MLSLDDYAAIFAIIGLAGVLLLASPTLGFVLRLSGSERFSELYILGPEHMAEGYPFNVRAGEEYGVYVGVGNHMGSSSYYLVYVKFRNQSDPLPNVTAGLPSPLPAVYEHRVFVEDEGVWESFLRFSFSGVSRFGNQCFVESLNVNGSAFTVNKTAFWDAANRGYYYQLFNELWIYDPEYGGFRFHNRFVSLWLNMSIS